MHMNQERAKKSKICVGCTREGYGMMKNHRSFIGGKWVSERWCFKCFMKLGLDETNGDLFAILKITPKE